MCFFGSIIIQKRPPWSFCQKGGTLYSGARYVALWASCLCTWAEGSSALLWSHVRRLSSVRPSLTFHIFDFSETADRNSTKLDREARSQWLLQSLCFQTDWKNKMAALVSNYLRHFRLLLWNRWPEFNETDGKQNLNVHWQVCVFGPIGKTRWPPLPLIGWDIFDFSSETAEQNSTKTWQETRPQRPLPSMCFSGRSDKQDGRSGLWLAETFFTSPLKPVNGIQRNLTGRKITISSIKFVFYRPIEKKDGRPGLWLTETFSTSPLKLLNGIQRNLTGNKATTSSTKYVFFGQIR